MEFALVLHAHLPYVRPDGPEILEERWLYEAVAETYLPLLWALENLQRDGVPARLAISLSGPLLSMLADKGLMARCRQHLARTLALAERQATRFAHDPLAQASAFHRERFAALLADFDRRGGDLIAGFRALEQAGVVELFTAGGTHAYLPLLATDTGRTAQIRAGIQEFERHFGHRPAGLWLPECAYAPGLDHLLGAAGVRWFIAEASMLEAAWPPAPGESCVRTPAGVAAFGRNMQFARQVWDARSGYPGDGDYREFYRDEGFDMPLEEVAPWLVEGRIRSDTGLKYYRIQGTPPHHDPYDPEAAVRRSREHARHYAGLLAAADGLVVTPFDAELFGHWWFEGSVWIEHLFREIAAGGGSQVRPVTPTDYLASAAEPPVVRLPAGSWGNAGDHHFWLQPANDFLWPRLHDAELRMLAEARAGRVDKPVLDQAVRELLIAQASDWPFILSGGTTVEFARKRVARHLDRMYALLDGTLAPEAVAVEDAVFPELDGKALFGPPTARSGAGPLRICMLSWEFPPANVGGLGRHVFDLGEALVRQGHTVHVITLADEAAQPGVERAAGMVVHRVARPAERGNFVAWVYAFNLAMVDVALAAAETYGPFDVVHSHDWLVGQAGMALQARWGAPLIATIHATERGRNGGIYEPIQQAIHAEEWQLTAAANAVITVSQAMAAEVNHSFHVTPTVIYNGVKLPTTNEMPAKPLREPYFFYIGRLVVEKGVQVAIWALSQLPRPVHLVVAGKGPMEGALKDLARTAGVGDRVHFVGRISDQERDAWLRGSVAGLVPSLYEPFGITALEVMAAGAPVIVGDTGGLAEIVTHGEDGVKVPPGDAGALATAMSRLLANPEDASRLAAAGMQTATKRFAWPAIAAQTTDVYKRALGRTALRSR